MPQQDPPDASPQRQGPSSSWRDWENDTEEGHAPPLTAEQAHRWRARHKTISPWAVLGCQAGVALLGAVMIWLILQESVAIISWLYGALAITLPAVFFARAVVRRASLGVLVFSELVKLITSVALIILAPWVLTSVAWWPLLLAIVLTVNMYWIAPLWLGRFGVSNK